MHEVSAGRWAVVWHPSTERTSGLIDYMRDSTEAESYNLEQAVDDIPLVSVQFILFLDI